MERHWDNEVDVGKSVGLKEVEAHMAAHGAGQVYVAVVFDGMDNGTTKGLLVEIEVGGDGVERESACESLLGTVEGSGAKMSEG